jgi:hypothetical protein
MSRQYRVDLPDQLFSGIPYRMNRPIVLLAALAVAVAAFAADLKPLPQIPSGVAPDWWIRMVPKQTSSGKPSYEIDDLKVESKAKPVVTRRADGIWEIRFVAENKLGSRV